MLDTIQRCFVAAGAWQPGTPHPSEDVSDHGDSHEEEEARHEYRVEFLGFCLCQPREGTVFHLVFLLVVALRPFAAQTWATVNAGSFETAIIRPAPPEGILKVTSPKLTGPKLTGP